MIGVFVLCRFQAVLGELREGATVGSEAGEPNRKKEAREKDRNKNVGKRLKENSERMFPNREGNYSRRVRGFRREEVKCGKRKKRLS